ncbi:MAG: protein kinase domain-containing protein [Gammaproteobacteria bacterium]
MFHSYDKRKLRSRFVQEISENPPGEEIQIQLKPFPVLPKPIRPKELKENGTWLTDAEMKDVIKKIELIEKENTQDKPTEKKHSAKTATLVRYEKDVLDSRLGILVATSKDGKKRYFQIGQGDGHSEEDEESRLLGKGKPFETDDGEEQTTKAKPVIEYPSGKIYVLKIGQQVSREDADLNYNNLVALNRIIGSCDRYSPSHHYNQVDTLIELALGEEASAMLKRQLSPLRCINIVVSFFDAIDELHAKGFFLHRDIKLENFIHDIVSGRSVLIDVEWAKQTKKVDDVPMGTDGYRAPEISHDLHSCTYNEATELYAIGKTIAVFLDLVEDENEDDEDQESNVLVSKSNSKFRTNLRIPKGVTSLEILEHLQDMTNENPEERGTYFEHKVFFKNIQQRLLQTNLVSVGILDAKEFLEATEEVRAELIKKMHAYEEIWIADTRVNPSKRSYWEIQRGLLDKNHFILGKYIYHAPGADIKNLIAKIPEKAKEFPGVHAYQTVTHRPSAVRCEQSKLFVKRSALRKPPVEKKEPLRHKPSPAQ